MDSIYHEKQKERLCGQHCLNNLLQGPYFGPAELSDLAQNIDNQERARMAECGTETESYREFLKAPSENVDDSGYFSVEVISAALVPWSLDLVPFNSSDERAITARENPSEMTAFICNYHQHWYTIRKIGRQWFNLDSTIKQPRLLSDMYLELYLAQIKEDGHSIFIVLGDLPACNADEVLSACPVSEQTEGSFTHSPDIINIDNDEDTEEDKDLKLALLRSMQDENPVPASQNSGEVDIEELRRKRMQHFSR